MISGLALGDSVLIRRTDFGTNHEPVEILAGTKPVTIEYTPGICKIISESGGIIKNINGHDIQFSVGEKIIEENFPVIAGSKEIVESLINVIFL